MSLPTTQRPGTGAPPRLTFRVEAAAAAEHAAVPTLHFPVQITSDEGVRALSLTCQIRIAVDRRPYAADEQERLADVLGAPGQTRPGSLLWAYASAQVPAFTGETVVNLPVACTYDFEVVAAKYLHGVTTGEVPLEFLFSGTVFYPADGPMRAARLPWDGEATTRMPVRVWKDLMEHYFPGSAWLRLERGTFDRLRAYQNRHTLPGLADTVSFLLRTAEGG